MLSPSTVDHIVYWLKYAQDCREKEMPTSLPGSEIDGPEQAKMLQMNEDVFAITELIDELVRIKLEQVHGTQV